MKSVSDLLREVRNHATLLRARSFHRRLAHEKSDQRLLFDTISRDFPPIYEKLKKYDITRFIIPCWAKNVIDLEKSLLPIPPFSFLRVPIILKTMFVTTGGNWMREELLYLEEKLPKHTLKTLLEEDYVGLPILINSDYLTSHNSIHHLYHFTRFSSATHCDLNQEQVVVEWGGGYGNMAKIFKRISPNSTYIIVDLPIFSALQWLYLSTIFGEANINLLQTPQDVLQFGKINILPICLLDRLKIKADLFISTWALNESSSHSQCYVANKKWFGAKHILLGYGGNSNWLEKTIVNAGATIEAIEFCPKNYYAFL